MASRGISFFGVVDSMDLELEFAMFLMPFVAGARLDMSGREVKACRLWYVPVLAAPRRCEHFPRSAAPSSPRESTTEADNFP